MSSALAADDSDRPRLPPATRIAFTSRPVDSLGRQSAYTGRLPARLTQDTVLSTTPPFNAVLAGQVVQTGPRIFRGRLYYRDPLHPARYHGVQVCKIVLRRVLTGGEIDLEGDRLMANRNSFVPTAGAELRAAHGSGCPRLQEQQRRSGLPTGFGT